MYFFSLEKIGLLTACSGVLIGLYVIYYFFKHKQINFSSVLINNLLAWFVFSCFIFILYIYGSSYPFHYEYIKYDPRPFMGFIKWLPLISGIVFLFLVFRGTSFVDKKMKPPYMKLAIRILLASLHFFFAFCLFFFLIFSTCFFRIGECCC